MPDGTASPADRVKRIENEVKGVYGQSVSSWEREFLTSIAARHTLSEKQEKILRGIEKKVFEEDPS